MARRVYFAFHYQNDISRVNVVRKSWVTKPNREEAGFYDASLWEKARKTGDEGIRRMINEGLEGTTVSVFLLGSETASRPWVKYELERSFDRGNGLISIFIHNIRDLDKRISSKGEDILGNYYVEREGRRIYLSSIYSTYDWVENDGYNNLGDWVEEAARKAAK
jgi:hypothetical protein